MACADCGILGDNRLLMKALLFLAVFACHAGTVVETSFLGGLKAVFSGGCDDRWTLLTQRRLPLEAQLSMCVHIRVLSQDGWVAFTYNTPWRKQPELGLQGDKEGLFLWLSGKKLHFPVHLVPQAWHHVCVAHNAQNKSLVLQVDSMHYWRKVYTSSTNTHEGQLVLGCGDISGQVAPIELYMFRMWDNASYHSDCKDGNLVAWTSELWNQHGQRAVPDATLPCGRLRVKREGHSGSPATNRLYRLITLTLHPSTRIPSTATSLTTLSPTRTSHSPAISPSTLQSSITSPTSHPSATSPTTLPSSTTSQPSANPLTNITLSKASPTSSSSTSSPTTLPSATTTLTLHPSITSPTSISSTITSPTSNSSVTSLTTLPSLIISQTSNQSGNFSPAIQSSITSPTSNSSATSPTTLPSSTTSQPSATPLTNITLSKALPTSSSSASSPTTLPSATTTLTSHPSITSPTTLSSISTSHPSATSPTTLSSLITSQTSTPSANFSATIPSSITSPTSNSSATSSTTLSSISTSHHSATSITTIPSSITSPIPNSSATSSTTIPSSIASLTSNSSATSPITLLSISTSHPSATSITTIPSSITSPTPNSSATSPGILSSSNTSPTSYPPANFVVTFPSSVTSPTSNSSATSLTTHSSTSTSHPSATSPSTLPSLTASPTPHPSVNSLTTNTSSAIPPTSYPSVTSPVKLLSATTSHPSSTTSPNSIPFTSISPPSPSLPTTSSNSSIPTTSPPSPTSTKTLTISPTPTATSINTTENATHTTHNTTAPDASTPNRSTELLGNSSSLVPPNMTATPRTTLPPDANTTLATQNATTNSACQCDSYCNAKAAYYSFNVTVNNPAVNITEIKRLISTLNVTTPTCRTNSSSSCSSSLTSQDDYVNCNNPDMIPMSYTVVLKLAEEQDVCTVREAVAMLFTGNSSINFTGPVCRVAICGPMVNISSAKVNWYRFSYSYKDFCIIPYVWPCQGEWINVNILNETCGANSTVHTVSTATSRPVSAVTRVSAVTTPRLTVVPTTTQSSEKQAQELLNQTMNAMALNSSQVVALVSSLEELLSGPNISQELGKTVISVVSNLLNANASALAASSTKIIGLVDTVGIKLVLAHPTETILSESVALGVKKVNGTNFQQTFFSILNSSSVQIDGNGGLKAAASSPVPQGSITLPASLTSNLTSQDKLLASRVQFNFYQKSTVFVDKSLGNRVLNSGILGSSVANLSISGLKDDVEFILKTTALNNNKKNVSCVFWDFTKNNGSGGWSSAGCIVQNTTSEQVTCRCNHLTSFAILLDISNDNISPVQNEILTYITYIGCGISAIFLSVTLLTYLAFEKLRRDIPSKILIQLCLALLLLNLVFLLDSWLALYPQATGLCMSTAFFLHYFLLASFTWMGLEAFHMYLALVKVFNTYVTRYMLKFCIVGWGVPLIVVVIIIALKQYGLASYGHFPDGSTDTFCWLIDQTAFYVGVVAYFCLVFLINLAMFVVVLVQLCRIKRQNPHNSQHRSVLQDLRSVAGLTVLLGLTWGFAFFAWGPINLPFTYLFSIFNSLQGFFIFVFHCAIKENVRQQWRTYLCCGRLRLPENSEWSRTATQNRVKNRSRILPGSSRLSNSTQSNNTTSSSFLASEPAESVNGIENPYDDRSINALEDANADVIGNEINSRHRTTRRQ